jgi:glycosyltransferase involved in cell wall biosynthesis
MRILVTHERFLPEYSGGCEYGVFKMARGLADRGMDVRVLTTGDPVCREYGGLKTLRLPMNRYRMNLAVGKIMESARDVDIIQTSNYHASLPAFLAGRRLGKPVVLLVTALCGNAWLEMRGPVLGRLYARWEKFLMRRSFDRIIFPSQYSRQIGIGMGISPDRCTMISPGIERHKFAPSGNKQNEVLFVGKFDRRKGVHHIPAIARALPEVHFRLLGWGPEEASLRKTGTPNMQISVVPPGAVMDESSGGQLQKAFADASIFFLPSSAESFGLVVAEAMASGCAIVSTVPLEYEGAHVDKDDTSGMIQAIRDLWHTPEQTAAMGRKNVELAQIYNWESFTGSLLLTYRQVLDETSRIRHN